MKKKEATKAKEMIDYLIYLYAKQENIKINYNLKAI